MLNVLKGSDREWIAVMPPHIEGKYVINKEERERERMGERERARESEKVIIFRTAHRVSLIKKVCNGRKVLLCV
jgi:hypothetical protein